MAFAGYLTTPELQALITAAIDSGLVLVPRDMLLTGIPAGFAGGLPIRANPNDQFADRPQRDERRRAHGRRSRAPGRVPSERGVPAQDARSGRGRVFEQAVSRIGNVSAGVPARLTLRRCLRSSRTSRSSATTTRCDIAFLGSGVTFAELVARINVPRFENGNQVTAQNGGPWLLHGTAWIIGPGLALTNHHVVNARRDDEAPASAADLKLQAESATLEFGFDQPKADPIKVSVKELL